MNPPSIKRKIRKMKTIIVTVLLAVPVVAACTSCASPEQMKSAAATMAEPGAEPAATEAANDAETGDPENPGHESSENTVMDQPMNGASLEDFNASLERVQKSASEADFKILNMALDWLLLYDLGARGDRATLYRRLDGNTPTQIIAKARR
jgi:ABC-type transport system substrate-binding protein